jgi:hypothetical protein
MKLQTTFLGGALATALAIGGCDSSKAELATTKTDLASARAERDGFKSQLDTARAHESTLAAQAADLTAKLAAAQTPKIAAEKRAEHAQGATAKKDEKRARRTVQASSRKG